MKSWILIVSYLWKDTWKRWFEQPGSVLARVVVTTVMVGISIIMLVAFAMQIHKVREQVKMIGVDSMKIVEYPMQEDLVFGESEARFSSIAQWGELLLLKKINISGNTSERERVDVMTYGISSILPLENYLKTGHKEFLLTDKYADGMIIEIEIGGRWIPAVCLHPTGEHSRLLQRPTLFIPSDQYSSVEMRGYAQIYFFKRDEDGPDISEIEEAVKLIDSVESRGRVDVQSASYFKKQLDQMEKQQKVMRFTMAGLLGGALALIYGTLSILEFSQQRYVSALMRSFGVPRLFLAARSVLESIAIVNLVSFGVIYGLRELHDKIYKVLRLQNMDVDLNTLYFSEEILWVVICVNLGVILSSIPTIRAMGKPVGKILS